MESLIYDRTLSDITNLTSKGKYNASDLNRVESWTNYLNDKFNEMGYSTKGVVPVYEIKNFTNTSFFNVTQHSTRTLVNEQTPISDNFIRLTKTQWEYPSSGFTLADKPELQFEGNVVACVWCRFSTNNRLPRVGWNGGTGGYSVWNCTSDVWSDCYIQQKDGWAIKRVKANKTNYENFKAGVFGFCQQYIDDDIVLDIASISFFKLTDEQFSDINYINSLGIPGLKSSEKTWKIQDDFVIEEADRIINNVRLLRGIIAMHKDTPIAPETMRFLDYIKANNIEKILFDIEELTENIKLAYRYSNTFYSGEVGLD